jgi:hypothetical protein
MRGQFQRPIQLGLKPDFLVLIHSVVHLAHLILRQILLKYVLSVALQLSHQASFNRISLLLLCCLEMVLLSPKSFEFSVQLEEFLLLWVT